MRKGPRCSWKMVLLTNLLVKYVKSRASLLQDLLWPLMCQMKFWV